MENFWDQRYSESEYAYGKEPNQYFKEKIDGLKPGKLLLPAEGEGRNAVYAAKKGWEVSAFDSSTEAIKKAEYLAAEQRVSINYHHETYSSADYPKGYFDLVALIYAHQIEEKRIDFHQRVYKWLKPNGLVVIEAFSKKQLGKSSGGPQKLDMLFSVEELSIAFEKLETIDLFETMVNLQEGKYHSGSASVIRYQGRNRG